MDADPVLKSDPVKRRVRPGYWFARKRYGLGATPVTPMGWIVTALYLAGLGGAQALLHDHIARIGVILSLTLIFAVLSWVKTDGGWGWKWGAKE